MVGHKLRHELCVPCKLFTNHFSSSTYSITEWLNYLMIPQFIEQVLTSRIHLIVPIYCGFTKIQKTRVQVTIKVSGRRLNCKNHKRVFCSKLGKRKSYYIFTPTLFLSTTMWTALFRLVFLSRAMDHGPSLRCHFRGSGWPPSY